MAAEVIGGFINFGTKVPDVVNVSVTLDANETTHGSALVWWDVPRKRISERYPPSAFSQIGLEQFMPGLICDENIEYTAFTWKTGAGESRLILDAGTPIEFREFDVYMPSGGLTPFFDYSDDGSSWSPVTIEETDSVEVGRILYRVAAHGTHAYWSVKRPGGTSPDAIAEIRFISYGDEFTPDYYIIDDGYDGVYQRIPAAERPTETRPLDLWPVARWKPHKGDLSRTVLLQARIVTVGTVMGALHESDGHRIDVSVTDQRPTTLALVDPDGMNADLVLPELPATLNIENATGAFTISGFLGGEFGAELFIRNSTAHQMGIVNNDSSSSDGFRTLTRNGSAVTVNGFGVARFKKLVNPAGWFLEYAADGTGLK